MSVVLNRLAARAIGATFGALVAAGTLAAGALPSTSAPAAAPVALAVQVPSLTVAQILDRHIAARGGPQAWKAVHALHLSGKIDAGRADGYARAMKMVEASKKANGRGSNAEIAAASGAKDSDTQVQLPFTLDLERPNKTRLEILFAGKTAVQVYDGEKGWKLRPFLNRTDAEPFTKDEARIEASRDDLGGPLMGAAAKGAKVEMDGAELIDGQPAYKLKITQKNGEWKHVWIDAKSFLDVKVDGFPRHMDGRMHDVYVFQRDFRKVDGVMIPFIMETTVSGYSDTHKMTIEKAAINPRLDDTLFAKPHV